MFLGFPLQPKHPQGFQGVLKIAASAITWNGLSCLSRLLASPEIPSMWSVISCKQDHHVKTPTSGVSTAAP